MFCINCYLFNVPLVLVGNHEQTDDSDDEFTLETNQFTKEVLSSAVPDAAAESESDEDVLTRHLPVHDGGIFLILASLILNFGGFNKS